MGMDIKIMMISAQKEWRKLPVMSRMSAVSRGPTQALPLSVISYKLKNSASLPLGINSLKMALLSACQAPILAIRTQSESKHDADGIYFPNVVQKKGGCEVTKSSIDWHYKYKA